MKKLFVGIDLSLNSTGVTFLPEDGQTRYLSILNRWIFTQSVKKTYKEIIEDSMLLSQLQHVENLSTVMIDRKPLTDVKKIGLINWSREHIRNCILYSNLISEHIEQTIVDYYYDCQVCICIENYSLGSMSKGTNSMQIIEITSMLKKLILEKDMRRMENYFIVPGPTLKMFAGSGDYDKYMMLRAYTSNNKDTTDGLFNFIINNEFLCYLKKVKPKKQIIKANKKLGIEKKTVTVQVPINEVLSPISDIIDSWWLSKHLEHQYKIKR